MKKTEPRFYIVSWLCGKIAGGKTTNFAGITIPLRGVTDGAGQERIREWVVSILETTNDDDLKKKVGASPKDVDNLGDLASRELDHYLAYFKQ